MKIISGCGRLGATPGKLIASIGVSLVVQRVRLIKSGSDAGAERCRRLVYD